MNGTVIIAVLSEAMREFGSITPQNEAEVTDWVRRRVRELDGRPEADVRPYVPRDFDAKARQAGDS